MEFKYSKTVIKIKKELNALDEFVIDFTSILNRLTIKYVLVSGYVSILFGRSRTSEDIDLIVEKLDMGEFHKLWIELYNMFECLNTTDVKDAFEEYLSTGHAIRFSKKNSFIPNVEFKFPKVELDLWTLDERKKVILNDHQLFISPLELQIPFKLYLGGEKDIEDAKHLYNLFQGDIDLALLQEFNRKLKTHELFNKYLK